MPDEFPTPLIRYLRVQETFERDMLAVLRTSFEDAEKILKKIDVDERIGATIRRRQIRAAQAEIKKEMATLWRKVGSQVVADRELAAAAAIQSMYDPLAPMLRAAGLSTVDVHTMIRAEQAFAKRGVSTVATRMNLTQIPLSQRVYKSQQLVTGKIDRIVNSHLARGSSARELAKDLREFIRPDVQGGVRYAAMRLGRTELNNAFHGTQVQTAIKNPMVTGMKWNLSGTHPKPDECNDYADGGDIGDGVFTPAQVPAKPHPNCLCYCTPQTPSREDFIARYQAGEYDSYISDIEGIAPPTRTIVQPTAPATATARKGAKFDSPAQWTGERKDRVFAQPYFARETVGNGMLKQMFTEQGWDGAMVELPAAEFDALVAKDGLQTVFRGVEGVGERSAHDLHRAFIDEDSPWVGTGFSGSGWYSGSDIATARTYTKTGDDADVLHMALRSDARVVTYDDLTKMINDRFDEIYGLGLADFTSDHGMLATMFGYDAIDVGGTRSIMVLLNRSAVIARGL